MGKVIKKSSVSYHVRQAIGSTQAQVHQLTLNLGLSSSTKPMRAPELQAMNTRGMPRSRAYSLALKKKSSSATPKEPRGEVGLVAVVVWKWW